MLNTSSETYLNMSVINSTVSPNVTSEEQIATGVLPTVIVVIVSCISLATIFGNIAVIICIVRNRRLRTVYNIYAASLALADLAVGVIVMTCMSVYTYYGLWPLGSPVCTVWVLFDFTCCTISMLHLDAVAFDRFKSVTSPLLYRTTFTKKRAVKISAFLWVLGGCLWCPSILYFRVTEQQNGLAVEDDCYFIPDRYFIAGQVTAAYYIPMVFMVAVYILLFNSLNKRQDRTENTIRQPTVATIATSTDHDTLGENNFRSNNTVTNLELKRKKASGNNSHRSHVKASERKGSQSAERAKISAQNRRCIRTLGAIIVVFLVCWLPFVLFWPIAAFCDTCIPVNLYTASYWLAYGNSFVNPYIYFLLNRDFRLAFGKTFLGRCRTRASYGHTLSQFSNADENSNGQSDGRMYSSDEQAGSATMIS